MKKHLLFSITLLLICNKTYTQNAQEVAGSDAITFITIESDKKAVAKEIAQFRSKEYIINHIIGRTNGKDIQFETESLASDDSSGLVSIAFNCNELNEKGLLLAFFGPNTDTNGQLKDAYGFRYIPLKKAQDLFMRIDKVQDDNKKYMSSDNDVNNVFIEFEDIKFIIYRDDGEQIRVFWNGFQIVWERAAFDRSKRRLKKWFD
ncbi:hypothetical protein [Flavivirga spongiicola]|uniref:DUF4252 domain-containing protein n=1 Tax=Flavivirga spongiicola TaxID=421621 RepID=A0ABU7XRR1_9FLAO|nr:hypothetical protein [Flavivirga sp. MEBiC05379]MDO5978443.1 hypothetical protein [Flavivirga sp. MEBiC05379]